METTLKITINKNELDESHVGDFVLRLPTIQEEIQIGQREKELIGKFKMLDLSPTVQNIVIAVACLEVVVVSAPPWWYTRDEDEKKVPRNLLEMTDTSIITMVYAEYFAWRWLPNKQRGSDEGSPESGEPAPVEAGKGVGEDDPPTEGGD